MGINFGVDVNEIKRIAIHAGEIIMEVYAGAFEETIEKKEDNSPLTQADLSANAYIMKELGALVNEYPILSEEASIPDYDQRKDMEYFWLVDPLDGTREFIKRNGDFSVNIALIKGENPVIGCVYIPVTRELYWAVEGQGAFVKNESGTSRLVSKYFNKDKRGLKILGSRSYLSDKTLEYIKRFDQPELIRRGSSIKMMLIAEGKGDLYPRMGTTMEWDTAASQIILEEAGGQILNMESKQALVYNKKSLKNPQFIAMGNYKENEN